MPGNIDLEAARPLDPANLPEDAVALVLGERGPIWDDDNLQTTPVDIPGDARRVALDADTEQELKTYLLTHPKERVAASYVAMFALWEKGHGILDDPENHTVIVAAGQLAVFRHERANQLANA